MTTSVKPILPTKLGFLRNTNGIDQRAPLIYRLWMKAHGGLETTFYIGKASRSSRPFNRYDLNVRNYIDGKPPINGSGTYRKAILDLLAAYRAGHQIGIELVRNVVNPDNIDRVEDEWQAAYGLMDKTRMLDDAGSPLPDFLARRLAARPLPPIL